MTRKTVILKPVSFFYAIIAAIGLAATAGTEEGRRDPEAGIAVPHLLDGMKFIGPTGEKGKKVHHEDVLSFSNGLFTSSECSQFGFKDGPYTATSEGDVIHFQAVTISPTHGKMVWQGTLHGDTLDVTYNWTKERWFWTTYREYWFKGSLVK